MVGSSLAGIALALGAAASWAALDVLRKSLGKDLGARTAVLGMMVFQIPLLVPAVALSVEPGAIDGAAASAILGDGSFDLDATYALLAALSIAVNVIANYLLLRALQLSPLGLVTPYLAFTPVFSALLALALFDERPTLLGWLGIVVVGIGAFALNPGNREHGVLAPFRALGAERGSVYALIVAALFSVVVLFDSRAVQRASPMIHASALAIGIAGGMLVWHVATGGRVAALAAEMRRRPGALVLAAGLVFGGVVLQLAAYTFLPVAYVEAVKRAVGVLGAIAGGALLFGEQGLVRHLVAGVIMVIGVTVVLVLAG